jgi:formyltetrahydrofolate hydrolase
MRVQFGLTAQSSLSTLEEIRDIFQELMSQLDPEASWELHPSAEKPKVLLMVYAKAQVIRVVLTQKQIQDRALPERCAVSSFYWPSKSCTLLFSLHAHPLQLPIEIPLIVSNHPDLKSYADLYKIPFIHLKWTKDTKAEAEAKTLELAKENHIDLVVMARFMQVSVSLRPHPRP